MPWVNNATPGDWQCVSDWGQENIDIMDESFRLIARTARVYPMGIKTEEANAMLLKSSTKLFKALAELVRAMRHESDEAKVFEAVHAAEAALKAAGGRET